MGENRTERAVGAMEEIGYNWVNIDTTDLLMGGFALPNVEGAHIIIIATQYE